MRLHRFYIEQKISTEGEIRISDENLIHQWKNVFRMEAGNEVILFDGSGKDFISKIISVDKREAVLKIESSENSPSSKPKHEVHLFQSLIKKDNFEWILEKCTELGVTDFHPIISERSEKKSFNEERAKKILIEASEQSGRGVLPTLHKTVSFEEALGSLSSSAIAFDPSGTPFPPNEANEAKSAEKAIFIGPEGGWSPSEVGLFHNKKIPLYSLGSQILRAETAAVAISAKILI